MTARKMYSADNLSSARWDRDPHAGNGALSPALEIEPQMGRSSPADWSVHEHDPNWESQKRPVHQALGLELTEENSKWIHRDKLAKIENAELQAAGLFIPRSRAPSKQGRNNSRMRDRPRKDSETLDGNVLDESAPAWDLRTPEEIADAEANPYFTSSLMGGSRIPVAKTSPAPIPLDFLERGSPALRRQGESFDNDTAAYPKTRSRSASATLGDGDGTHPPLKGGKRSFTDTSPKKAGAGARKTSTASKNGTPKRPTTRSGPKDSPGRPATRDGSVGKAPEGDPPWMANSYKPDPRLPPDQQLLPTVARRLQQEKWEKEGKFGDVYDTEFRPLNDNEYLKPSDHERGPTDEENQQHSSEWPLKPGASKSPPLRSGSYSTMPKISDKPPPISPMGSPRTPGIAQMPNMHQEPQQDQPQNPALQMDMDEAEKKGGCGCCVVM